MIHIPHYDSTHGTFSLSSFSLELPNKELKLLRNSAIPEYTLEARSSDTELKNC